MRHHLPLAVVSTASVATIALSLEVGRPIVRWSIGSAYVSLALLVGTLAVGPIRALRRERIPISIDTRRDLGIWAGLVALMHGVLGAFVHLQTPWLYIFDPEGFPQTLTLRTDLFGLANYMGIAAVAIVVVLLATSNDWSVKVLRARRWKATQRLAYGLAVGVLVHGWMYQALESRPMRYVLLGSLLAGALGVVQASGVVARRRASRQL